MFWVYAVLCFSVSVVSTSAVNCIERLVSEMCRVERQTLLTHSLSRFVVLSKVNKHNLEFLSDR